MKIQVLLACMNQKDHSIVRKANLKTDAIIVNQADRFEKEVFLNGNSEVTFLTFDEKGVGLNRNNALMRATADLVTFADEDMTYVDDYETIILKEFDSNPDADMIVFNVPSVNPRRQSASIEKRSRVRLHNCLKYGTVRMVVKTEKIRQKDLYFSLLFGGGAKYSSGEDSRFIYQAIKNGLKVYAVPRTIGYVAQDESSWFEGYTKKYFVDKGALYRSLSPNFHFLFSTRFILKNYRKFSSEFSILSLLKFTLIESKSA